MYPIIINFGFFSLHTYGLMVGIGFVVATQYILWQSQRVGFKQSTMSDVIFWSFAVGMLGARMLFVMTDMPYFMRRPLAIFAIWEGGSVFLGGLIAGTLYLLWYTRRIRYNIPLMLDVTIPGITIAHAIGRIGCFAAGCCYGKPTQVPWAVKLHSDFVPGHLHDVPLHPTQLYEALGLLVLFVLLVVIFELRTFRKKDRGWVLVAYSMIYPCLRFCIEMFRGDEARGFVMNHLLSTSQFISVLLLLLGFVFLVLKWKKKF